MTYNIFTIGCQMNKADSERLSFYLENIGFKSEIEPVRANLIIFVTCGVKQSAEDRVYGIINQVLKKNKKAIIFVTGCLSDRPDVQERLKGKVKTFFNIINLINLNKELKKYFPKIKYLSESNFKNYLDLGTNKSSSFSAFVPIGNGCNNFCSYCVVPYARGREIYRPAEDIIEEVKALVKNGYKEINLIAQNVNSYKSSMDFPSLLGQIDKIPGDFWIRFSTSHPKDVSPNLIKVLKKSKKICEHFHLAVQSGDNDILDAMNRKYKIEDYKKLVKKIREALDYKNGFPVGITTDIIVGFPGETRRNFLNTLNLIKELKFDLIYISKYSPRYGTASAKMKDSVSLNEKKKRELELNNLLKKIAFKNNQEYLGKEIEVLVEGISRKGEVFGKTRTAKIVRISELFDQNKQYNFNNKKFSNKNFCSSRNLIGNFVKVKIIKAMEFELRGELVLDSQKNKIIALLGPTSSGKTSLAVKIAYNFNGEIISADSRQVYKGMDIGTGKDLGEYNYKNKNIPYHLIDVVSPKSTFSLAKYQKMAFKAIEDVLGRKKLPILVGGSGLYLESIINNYALSDIGSSFKNRDAYESLEIEELHNRIKKANLKFFNNLNNSELHNKRRLARYLEILLSDKNFYPQKEKSNYNFLILGLNPERDIIKDRIYKRLIKRLEDEDMVGEIKKLKKSGVSFKKLENFGLEYKFVSWYLQKKINYQQLVNNLFIAICQFSKRQMSWFRRMEKQGSDIKWIKNWNEARCEIKKYLKN